jgi:hypothetical protein
MSVYSPADVAFQQDLAGIGQGIGQGVDTGAKVAGFIGVGVLTDGLGDLGAAAEGSFFDGTTYSSKVLQQMQGGAGEFHSFPESVTAFESSGTVSTITGGDGQAYQMLEIPGSYQSAGGTWYNGSFQFIQDENGVINHRLFVPSP